MSRINGLFGVLTAATLGALVLIMMWPGLQEPLVEGLDGAHHLMDGLFFYDLFHDRPYAHVIAYTLNYYRHYPALGFIFWPPFFPFIEGLTFHLLGTQIQAALVSLWIFGGVLTASFWWLAKRWLMSNGWAWLATALLITASVLLPYWNTVMREIPVLGMMLLWLVCWVRWLEQATISRAMLVIMTGWLVIYTKQTGALIFMVAAIDLLLSRRERLAFASTWWAIGCFVVGALPLVIWTLTYGRTNLSQSFGVGTQLIMPDYEGDARWSWAAWRFYPMVLMDMIPKLLWPGLLLSVIKIRDQRYRLCSLWLIVFYLLFSYFDNREARFAILALPPLVLLTTVGWSWIAKRFQVWRWPIVVLMLCALWQQLALAVDYVPRGERGLEHIVANLHLSEGRGNIAYVGKYRQLWVYHQRMQDPLRRRAVLQGEDLLALTSNWPALLHDYQVAYVVSETQLDHLQQMQLSNIAKRLPDAQFTLDDHAVTLYLWQYTGPQAVDMPEIPLHSHLIE